jgi:hypothetical protein
MKKIFLLIIVAGLSLIAVGISQSKLSRASNCFFENFRVIDSVQADDVATIPPPKIPNPLRCGSAEECLVLISKWLTAFASVVFAFIFLLGGVKYMTSMGNPDAQQKAKMTFVWGIVGLIIILAAYAGLRFLENRLLNPSSSPTSAPTYGPPAPPVGYSNSKSPPQPNRGYGGGNLPNYPPYGYSNSRGSAGGDLGNSPQDVEMP